MKEPTLGKQYRITTICIDEYENSILCGQMYDPGFNEGIQFNSTIDFIKKLDAVMEDVNYPQAYMERRGFKVLQYPDREKIYPISPRMGKKATFTLRVLYRQHSSWQGTLSWIEGKKGENFRSVLELLFLMDNVLKEKG